MNENLYEMMDWAEIEAVVYSEEDRPQDILGTAYNRKRSVDSDIYSHGKRSGGTCGWCKEAISNGGRG